MKKEYVKTARLGVGKTTARAVTGTESVGIGAPSRQVWDRAKKLTAIMLSALLIASMLSVPLLSLTAKPAHAAPGDWVAAGMPRELGEVYAKYHTVQDSDMPPSYNEYAAEYFNMLYYSTLDNHTIYCIEIFEHAYIAHPDESATPPQSFSSETKQKLLAYLLANGERFHRPTEESVKLQTATQIAVWLLSDNFQDNAKVIDLVCGLETGSQPDTSLFAPTLEVGRMARALLNDAKAFVAGGGDMSSLLGSLPPSYASLAEADAKVWPMKATDNGDYAVDLKDENGTTLNDWNTHLKVVDAAGMQLKADGDTLHISGKPEAGKEYLIRMSGPYSGYALHYLSSTEITNSQRMTRLARISDVPTPLYVKVKMDEGTDPTDPKDPTDPTDPTKPTDPTNPTKPTPPGKGILPKTGDTLPLGLLTLLLGGAATTFIVAGLLRKRSKSLHKCVEQQTEHLDLVPRQQ
jgi:hypothetical protein